MVKEYIRKCDECGKVIENLYDYGVTTLFRNIRIGRGHQFHDYQEGHINNLTINKTPDDFDSYGRGWSNDENKEFSFCCPEHFFSFMLKLYQDTYSSSLKNIKSNKKERIDDELKRMKERHEKGFPVIREVARIWQSKEFKKEAIKDINYFLIQLETLKKELKKGGLNSSQP